MFRSMRRKKQLLSQEDTLAVLQRGTSGVLAVSGDDGYPYAVPVSYAYKDGKLYFHSAIAGHKLESIQKNDKVSFCVIDKDEVIQETFTTHFRSAIAFGRARILTDDFEKRQALMILAQRYSPDFIHNAGAEIDKSWKQVTCVVIDVEHLTGKQASELVDGSY